MLIGGENVSTDRNTLKQSMCQVCVGTVGRLLQLVNDGALSLDAVRLFVLDEADKMMDDSLRGGVK